MPIIIRFCQIGSNVLIYYGFLHYGGDIRNINLILALFLSLSYSATITSVDPDNTQQGQSLTVTITGENTHFYQGSPTLGVWFSQASSTIFSQGSPTINSNTSLSTSFDIPSDASIGEWNVNVENNIDGLLSLTNGFTIAGCDNCDVCDTDLSNDCVQDCTDEWGGDVVVDECGVCGGGGANVECWDGSLICDETECPVGLISINPDNTQQGQSLTVTITGENTHFYQGSPTLGVWFSQASSTIFSQGSPTINSNTSLSTSFDIPSDASIGEWNVNVENNIDGLLSLTNGFTIAGCDNCDVCDTDPSNDCVQDCTGEWGGDAIVNECGVCDGGGRSCLGDLNGDGQINVIDIVMVVDLILNDNYDVVGDVNEDGQLNVIDIVMLVDWVLNGMPEADSDGDGVIDEDDSDPNNPYQCSDLDGDTCDDCSTGTFNPSDDGYDYDADGQCDDGDCDDDNDGCQECWDYCP